MTRWNDLVPRQEHTTQQRSPRRARPSKFIIHTADGYFDGTISWQKGPNSVSSHFISGKNQGEVAQMADTEDEAWTQSDANRYSISSENAGFGERGEALTAWQLEINAQLLARAHREYPDTLPLRLMNGPDESGLGWHGMGGNPWGGHFGCPGEAIKAQLPQILNRAIEIVNGDDMTPEQALQLTRIELTLGSAIQGLPATVPQPYPGGGTQSFPIVPNQILAELKARPPVQAGPVDPAAVKAALLDPDVLAAIAKAVNDDSARRQAA